MTDTPAGARYFLGHDDSGHDYAVPIERQAEWLAWLAIPEDDERAWEAPTYAIALDGRFTFSDPRST